MSTATRYLAALLLAALAVRAAAVALLPAAPGRPVTYEHGEIAENLLAGKGFTVRFLGQEGPTSQQAPFYPYLLAGAYALWGVGPAAVFALQMVQCLAGAGLVWGVFALTRQLLPREPSAAWAAAISAAFYPPHVYMVTHLQVALWATLTLVLLLLVVTAPRWRSTWTGAVLAGMLSGLALLIDPILALALPIAALAFVCGSWALEAAKQPESRAFLTLQRPLIQGLVMAAVALAVIAPWLVRNRQVHGEWVFIKSTFGYAFWQGNNPASFGTDKIPKPSARQAALAHDGSLAGANQALWEARHETLYIDDVLLKPGGYRQFEGLSEPARSRLLAAEAWDFIAREPGAYAALCGQRLRYFLWIDETNPKASHPLYRASTAAWLVLAGLGLLLSPLRARALWPTWAICGALTLFHVLTITSVRFRIPLESLTLVWAGLAVGPLAERLWIATQGPAAAERYYRQDPPQTAAPVLLDPAAAGPASTPVEAPVERRSAA